MGVMAHDVLAERYGTSSPWRRRVVVAGSVLVSAVFLGWLTWTALAHADPDVSSELVAFQVDGDHEVSARLHLELGADDVRATCLLRAIAEDHTVVGELSFEVDAADVPGAGTLERSVRTERRATSVELLGCTTPDQPRPR
jgi:hypothetical protein